MLRFARCPNTMREVLNVPKQSLSVSSFLIRLIHLPECCGPCFDQQGQTLNTKSL